MEVLIRWGLLLSMLCMSIESYSQVFTTSREFNGTKELSIHEISHPIKFKDFNISPQVIFKNNKDLLLGVDSYYKMEDRYFNLSIINSLDNSVNRFSFEWTEYINGIGVITGLRFIRSNSIWDTQVVVMGLELYLLDWIITPKININTYKGITPNLILKSKLDKEEYGVYSIFIIGKDLEDIDYSRNNSVSMGSSIGYWRIFGKLKFDLSIGYRKALDTNMITSLNSLSISYIWD